MVRRNLCRSCPLLPDTYQNSDLWLASYHTGAGLNDVVFSAGQPGIEGIQKGFFNATNVTGSDNLLFDLGNDFAWGLKMVPNEQFYAAWQPVELNAGVSGSGQDVSGFFMSDTGLQWNSSSFGGWIGERPALFSARNSRGQSNGDCVQVAAVDR